MVLSAVWSGAAGARGKHAAQQLHYRPHRFDALQLNHLQLTPYAPSEW